MDQSCYTVHQDSAFEGQQQRPPYTALKFVLTRLNDELEPMTDEEDAPITETVYFSFGGKSLPQIHPANGTGPDDEEPEDLGTEVAIEGNTVNLIKEDFKLNPKSGLANLSQSLTKIGYTPEHMTRMWAPDFKGVIFHMKTQLSTETMKGSDGVDRPIPYKVADKFFPAKAATKAAAASDKKGPGKETASAKGSNSASGGGGKNAEAETLLDPILMNLSETLDGQSITRKALSTKVSAILQEKSVDTKLHIPILTLVKDNAWLTKNGAKYDFELDAENGTVTFGKAA